MFFLWITILADALGVVLLGKARGFESPIFLATGLIAMNIAFLAFSIATKTVSVGIANAVWAGLSATLVFVFAGLWLDERASALQLVCAAMVVAGAIGVQYFGQA